MSAEGATPVKASHTALIVDDDQQCRYLFSELFKLEPDFNTVIVESAEAAQEILIANNFDFDVCLVDMVLPGMQGEDLLHWIKSRCIKMPVVMISGHRDGEALVRCLNDGAIEFVEKPVRSDRLFKVLTHAIDRQAQVNEVSGDIQAVFPSSDWVELTAPSEMEYLARIQRFTEVLLESHLPIKVQDDVRLAMEEFGRNAVEWGNKFDRSKQFSISYCIFPDRIVFKFEDEGEGFKPESIRDPSKDPRAHIMKRKEEGKRPGGFGIYLVQKLMDEVVYSERGNVVLMTKFLAE